MGNSEPFLSITLDDNIAICTSRGAFLIWRKLPLLTKRDHRCRPPFWVRSLNTDAMLSPLAAGLDRR